MGADNLAVLRSTRAIVEVDGEIPGVRGWVVSWEFNDTWDSEWCDAPPWVASAPDPSMIAFTLGDEIFRSLDHLPERESAILIRRLGLEGDAETLQMIGDDLGVSRERIRQLEARALQRVLRLSKRRRLADVDSGEDPGAILRAAFGRLRQDERGQLLTEALPGAARRPTTVLVGLLLDLNPEVVDQWLGRYFHRLLAPDRAQRSERRLARILRNALGEPAPRRSFFPVRSARQLEAGSLRLSSEKLAREIEAESGLELQVYRVLDASDSVVSYLEQPVSLAYEWRGRIRRYFPDVAVKLADDRHFLLEVKPAFKWAEAINHAKWSAALQWCEQRGWRFVVTDYRTGLDQFLDSASEAGAAVLVEFSNRRSSNWHEFHRAWLDEGLRAMDIAPTALANGFAFDRRPFAVVRSHGTAWVDAVRSLSTPPSL